MNNKIELSFFRKLLYLFGRAIDKYYFLNLRNLGIKLLVKSMLLNLEKKD